MDCVGEVWLGAWLDCFGEVGFGARRGLCRQDLDWSAAVDCVGEGWIGARLRFVSTRLGLVRGVDCVGEVGFGARRGLWGWEDGNAAL